MNKREDIVEGAKFRWNSEPFDIVTITRVDGDTAYFECDSDNYTSDIDLNEHSGWQDWKPLDKDGNNIESSAIIPTHYNSTKISALDVIDDWKLEFRPANAIKYIQRHPNKGKPIEDLEKAVQYLQLEIKRLKKDAN